jgi:hypothetical protein
MHLSIVAYDADQQRPSISPISSRVPDGVAYTRSRRCPPNIGGFVFSRSNVRLQLNARLPEGAGQV